MPERVTSKAQMYRMLAAGAFGNTTEMWMEAVEWLASNWSKKDGRHYKGTPEFWGVRTLTPGGPCRLNCPTADVFDTAADFEEAGHKVQISMMVDRVATVTAWLEVWDSPTGLVVEGIEHPETPEWTWRNSMPDPVKRKSWTGTAARMVLARHLNENSRADLEVLLAQYPDHVVEMSALDRCIGMVKHRNGIVWEVRAY